MEAETPLAAALPGPRPRRGELLDLEIDDLAFGGAGLARREGFVVFVAGGLPGDRVRAEVTKSKKRFAEARAVELLRPGADRAPNVCLHGGEPCPGAPWQGLQYQRQLAYKQQQVDDALRRIGGLEGFELEPIEPAVERWRYRNKLEYTFGADGAPAPGCSATSSSARAAAPGRFRPASSPRPAGCRSRRSTCTR